MRNNLRLRVLSIVAALVILVPNTAIAFTESSEACVETPFGNICL